MSKPKTIEVPVWYSNGGGMMVKRDYLDWDDPENTYNYIQRTYNVNPEDYGIKKPPIPDHKKPTNAWGKTICPHCGK